MSILIKGMVMPPNCCQCPVNMEVCKRGYEYLLKHPELYDKRADDCPLIHVPPHGRLIDADEAIGHLFNGEQCLYSWDEIEDSIDATETIIPAEEGE